MSIQNDDVIIEPEEDGVEEKLDSKLKKLRDELKRVKSERDDYLAGWQRSKADYVNLSRRAREDGQSLKQDGVIKLSKDIISVFDSLEAAHKAAEGKDKAVLDGIEHVIRQLESTLKEHGVKRFTPIAGDDFDPNMHEPMSTVATENEKEDNTISETLQSGFEIEGIVVRPARVSVKKLG